MAATCSDGEARGGRGGGSGPTYPPPQPPGLSAVLERNIRALAAPFLVGLVLSLSACVGQFFDPTIVIDPGHGGVDPGAIGSTGNVLEKDVVLRMGLALRDQLEATGRYQVIMTRSDDRFVALRDRLQIARQSEGELFISLHADSLVTMPEVRGAAVYTLSAPASNGKAARLASRENRAATLAGTDSAPAILVDPRQRDANDKSIRIADLLMQELNGATRMAKRRRAQAGFVVLTSPDMPSVLIELGYLSNPADEKALADGAHIARLAAAVAQAVDGYFGAGSS